MTALAWADVGAAVTSPPVVCVLALVALVGVLRLTWAGVSMALARLPEGEDQEP